MMKILKGLVAVAVAVFSLNNPAQAAAYVGRAVHSVEQIVVSALQSGGEAPASPPAQAPPSNPGSGR